MVNDPAARLSLLRTGRGDILAFAFLSHLTSIDQAVNLQKTNPDLVLHPFSFRTETGFSFNNQKEPWSDIRVRRALNMAVDVESIAENYLQCALAMRRYAGADRLVAARWQMVTCSLPAVGDRDQGIHRHPGAQPVRTLVQPAERTSRGIGGDRSGADGAGEPFQRQGSGLGSL